MTDIHHATAMPTDNVRDEIWPALPLATWQSTYQTLHMWTQVVGKVQLALNPPVNHWWAVAFYVTSRGLTTSSIPYGMHTFSVTFDLIDHALWIRVSDGESRRIALYPRSVADFYHEFMAALHTLGIDITINPLPQEVANPIRCDEDYEHCYYDAASANHWWRIMVQSDRVLRQFRARFIGKCSPVHFFWGGFDLAVSRFSGRRAPDRPEADHITREAYSHEVSSCGFWPGTPGGPIQEPAYYAYMVPEPPGFAEATVLPASTSYNRELGEFILPYDAVRTAYNPDAMLLDFAQSTYEVGANLAAWDRAALER